MCHEQLIVGDDITNSDIVSVFQMIDQKSSGLLNYFELLRALRGTLTNVRRALLERVFDKLEIKKAGHIDIENLKLAFVTQNHPDVLIHKRCEEEVLDEFIETLDLWRF